MDSERTITDSHLRQLVGYNMKRTYLVVAADIAQTLAAFDLRIMTFSALAMIVENPDLTQTELSQALSIERSGVVGLVDELESQELISRNQVKGDRRAYALRATLAGQRFWQKAEAAVKAHEARIFAPLNETERTILRDLLQRVEHGKHSHAEAEG